jgi:hypothetical protein
LASISGGSRFPSVSKDKVVERRQVRIIPKDVPAPDIASWRKMYGQALAREIPGARFAEITAKAISGQKHVEHVRREILRFIGEIDSKLRERL